MIALQRQKMDVLAYVEIREVIYELYSVAKLANIGFWQKILARAKYDLDESLGNTF